MEEYLDGIEVVVEGLLGSDGLEVLTLLDKPDPMEGPFFEETMFVAPSRLDARPASRRHRRGGAGGRRPGPLLRADPCRGSGGW